MGRTFRGVCGGCEPEFQADEFSLEQPEGVLYGGFRADDGSYLMLQWPDAFDEQDRELGMDTYHVELDSQAASGYGGIERIEVHAGCAHFFVSAAAARFLEVAPEFCIGFDTGIAATAVVAGLSRFVGADAVAEVR